jgi:hypothetical protein
MSNDDGKNLSLRQKLFAAVLRRRTRDIDNLVAAKKALSSGEAPAVSSSRAQKRYVSAQAARNLARSSGVSNPSSFETHLLQVLPGQRAREGRRIERLAEDMPVLSGSLTAGYRGLYLKRRVRV